jgi:hypothetical protein
MQARGMVVTNLAIRHGLHLALPISASAAHRQPDPWSNPAKKLGNDKFFQQSDRQSAGVRYSSPRGTHAMALVPRPEFPLFEDPTRRSDAGGLFAPFVAPQDARVRRPGPALAPRARLRGNAVGVALRLRRQVARHLRGRMMEGRAWLEQGKRQPRPLPSLMPPPCPAALRRGRTTRELRAAGGCQSIISSISTKEPL